METFLRHASYLESLVSVVAARVPSIRAEKAAWSSYDLQSEGDAVVAGASEKGVELKDGESTQVLPWGAVPPEARVALLEEVRNPRNAMETLWVAYYCRLLGSPVAEQYFDFVLAIDDSAEMRKLVTELQAG
jgi:hypothetical protein